MLSWHGDCKNILQSQWWNGHNNDILLCNNSKIVNIFSLFVIFLYFFPIFDPQCSSVICPLSSSLCAWVSNELVWFLFPATGIFFLPSPSSSHLPLSYVLPCFLFFFLSMPLCPQRALRVAFSHLKRFNSTPIWENPNHNTTVCCLEKLLMFSPCGPHLSYRCEKCMSTYHCPQARHRQHHPRLCGRMFKWEAFSHTWDISRYPEIESGCSRQKHLELEWSSAEDMWICALY